MIFRLMQVRLMDKFAQCKFAIYPCSPNAYHSQTPPHFFMLHFIAFLIRTHL